MINLLKRIYTKLFYNPYNIVNKNPNINIGTSTILLKSTQFRILKTNKVIIGKESMVGCNFIFESGEGEIEIGNNTFINMGTDIIARTRISIGNNVMISWGCTIYDHNSHSLDWKERVKDLNKTIIAYNEKKDVLDGKNWDVVRQSPIIIEDKVWIGFGCTILAGVTIGEGAVIGSHSVIRKDVEPWSVMIGNPAVLVKKLNHE